MVIVSHSITELKKIGPKAVMVLAVNKDVDSEDEQEGPRVSGLTLVGEEEGEDSSESSDQLSTSSDLSYRASPVMDSLSRGYDDKLQCDNLVLEINSSRYAYNVTVQEVNYHVVRALVSLPSPDNYWGQLRMQLGYFLPILVNYIRNQQAQEDCLQALEEVATSRKELRDSLLKLLHLLYEQEILGEEAILKWHSSPDLDDPAATPLRNTYGVVLFDLVCPRLNHSSNGCRRLMKNQTEKMAFTAFQRRGYPKPLIDNQISRALSRDDYDPPKKVEDIPLPTQYHPGLQRINTILKRGYKFLTSSPQTQNLLSSPPRVTFKRPPNLHNILVHPKLPDPKRIQQEKPTTKGSYLCGSTRCSPCGIHLPATSFNSKKLSKVKSTCYVKSGSQYLGNKHLLRSSSYSSWLCPLNMVTHAGPLLLPHPFGQYYTDNLYRDLTTIGTLPRDCNEEAIKELLDKDHPTGRGQKLKKLLVPSRQGHLPPGLSPIILLQHSNV
uniref:W2 domain-containing protein n=1 Tax=Timema douglasi TaxID=61478 RepID=A0A7R8VLW0_TIMDO|nr:unnamed protein product [Timema douglasi]